MLKQALAKSPIKANVGCNTSQRESFFLKKKSCYHRVYTCKLIIYKNKNLHNEHTQLIMVIK